MTRLKNKINWGDALFNLNPLLVRQLDTAYNSTALAVNQKSTRYTTDGLQKPHVNPPANSQFNTNFDLGDLYVRTDTNTAWIMTSRADSENVTWTQIT